MKLGLFQHLGIFKLVDKRNNGRQNGGRRAIGDSLSDKHIKDPGLSTRRVAFHRFHVMTTP